MTAWFRRTIVVAVVAACCVPPPATAGIDAQATTIAVVPLLDGDADEESCGMSREIRFALSATTAARLLDADVVDDVLSYHPSPRRSADDVVARAEETLARAKEQYFQFRTGDARGSLESAVAQLEADPEALSKTGALLVDAYLTRAVVERAGSRSEAARQYLAAALAVYPALEISEAQYPPSIRGLFDEERRRIEGLPSGSLAVATEPPAAEVFLNGNRIGASPLEVRLPAGNYRVRIRTNRYGDVDRTVDVKADARAEVRERLRWVRGDGRGAPAADGAAALVREGLRIADLLVVDKVILVDVDGEGVKQTLQARMIDRSLRAGQRPIELALGGGDDAAVLADLTAALAAQAAMDLQADPARTIDPKGMAHPVLLGRRRAPIFKSPIFWGIVGAIVAGGVGGGIAASLSGGSGERGSVRVNFR